MNIRFMRNLRPALKPVAVAGRSNLGLNSKNTITDFFNRPMLMTAGNSGNRKVRAQRRRRGTSKPGERERADAPSRERDKQPSKPPAGGGGSGSGSGRPTGGLPLGGGGKRPPMILIGIVLVLVVCGMFFFGGGGDENQQLPDAANQTNTLATSTTAPAVQVAQNTPTPVAQAAPAQSSQSSSSSSSSSEGQTWLIMMYQDADDKVLERDIYIDLNEAEKVGSSDRVHIVSQMDRYQAGFRGDGDWDGTRRLYVTQDNDLERVSSEVVMDIGEANMSSGQTLVDFMVWAINAYPADKHVLIMSDHGMGWPGGWTDPSHSGRGEHDIPLSQVLGDELYLMEIDDALTQVRTQTGIDKFEMVGMDACLMGHLEVFSALAPHANYAVASQETEPALGWAYASFLAGLQQNPDMSGADLSRLIVDSYIREDQRIIDDAERAKFAGQGSPLGGLFGMLGGGPSPQQIEAQLSQNMTLTAVDLTAIPALNASFNDLAFNLQRVDQRAVAQARNYSQSFTSVFGNNVPPSYIDIGHFVQVIRQASRDQTLNQSLDQVLATLDQTVIAEKHGPKKPGATGISIYFPNSQLYQSPAAGPPSYTVAARRFAAESLWDDFLTFHYTGRQFQPANNTVSLPSRNDPLVIPGLGKINVSPVALSSNTVTPSETVLISAEIDGDNIGYIKLFVGFYDQAANAINIADTDYLESSSTVEVDGIYYPDWGTGSFTLEFAWEPIVFGIDDGTDTVVAHFKPATYGATFEDAIYTVDGIYTYGDGGEQRYARLYFNNGLLKQVFGFTGENGTGSPREIIPETGDQFTVIENWLDLDQQGNVAERTQELGGTLTFGNNTFIWKDLTAAAGNYLVGFVVEDLDGNEKEVFQVVTVQ